jgi:probable rRNA maturation factor
MVKSSVRFGYVGRSLPVSNKRAIQKFIVDLILKERKLSCSLQYVFCSDEYLHEINRTYLNHDDYTDIITFDLSDDAAGPVVGEIYISIDRVADNAKSLGISFTDEILRVMFHGALHLCGYGDKTEPEKEKMRRREDHYLTLFHTTVSRET